MSEKILSDQARAARREYARAWRAQNKDRVRDCNRRYWEKKAKQLQENDGMDGGGANAEAQYN